MPIALLAQPPAVAGKLTSVLAKTAVKAATKAARGSDDRAATGKQQASLPNRLPAMVPGTVGKGPLTLISSAAVTYQEYFAHVCPMVLTVDAFGWATHALLGTAEDCAKGTPYITQAMITGTVNACETYARNPPCSVIAVGRKVFWDGAISVLPGRFAPQGDNQFTIVLRKIVGEADLTTAFHTTVGLITYNADGESADIQLRQHAELGLCGGSLRRHDGDTRTVALHCTKAGAITGTFSPDPDGRTGAGTAAGRGEQPFVLKVLPHPDFLANGSNVIQPAPEPEPPTSMKQPEKGGKS